MTLSMYQASVPVFVRQFASLTAILDKGAAFAAERGIDPSELIEARLAPDMAALPRQIQIASDGVKGCIARLAGIDVPGYADTETTFDALKERIAKTVAFIESVPADQIDGTEDREISLKFGEQSINLSGQAYLLTFVLPNFFFHVSIAYALLRSKGVEIGKRDYLGG
ncbi:DUF1993 domain-containing protein [Polymorphobacter sp. PAMC 29334]|uniref:DUF1993 domain-containing protein n=1 Tax=Polymorphobacter sp. PAMC 29334 TaxID=2862331 RepID=UPI001C66BD75|nr:DUF1993 domain-containing protein [Polymorphobacter sp. PAMC 29334]QYE35823.1 DUF1993 domain-containing protein [Polymorphobacter sp. PAMC 29334]